MSIMSLSVGDRVVFIKNGPDEVKDGDETILLMRQGYVLGTVVE
jgi:co-chaperonin GroES (HSP10)